MFRALFRLILFLVIVVAAGTYLLGWWGKGSLPSLNLPSATATSGRIDADRARAAGAEVGQRAAEAANAAGAVLGDGALTAKIKSKMALDDTIKATDIRVSTDHHVVTMTGTVHSAAEHDRAVQLARETAGVTRVIDHLSVAR